MTRAARLLFLIPAYNEEDNLGRVLETLGGLVAGRAVDQVIVVNDGSRDRTREVALAYRRTLPVVVIDHATNLGPGAAFRTGFRAALAAAAPDDVIVTLEADGSTDLGILPLMLQQIDAGSDLSLASCYAPGGRVCNLPIGRRWLSRCGNRLFRAWLRVEGIHTYSSFFRAYRCGALQSAVSVYGDGLITEAGFVSVVEVLVKLRQLGCRITEVPAVLDWGDRSGGSKLRPVATIGRHLAFLARQGWWKSSATP